MAVSGATTKEYRAIKHHYATLIDTLGKTVNPAMFAGKLLEKSLVSDGAYDILSSPINSLHEGLVELFMIVDASINLVGQLQTGGNSEHLYSARYSFR